MRSLIDFPVSDLSSPPPPELAPEPEPAPAATEEGVPPEPLSSSPKRSASPDEEASAFFADEEARLVQEAKLFFAHEEARLAAEEVARLDAEWHAACAVRFEAGWRDGSETSMFDDGHRLIGKRIFCRHEGGLGEGLVRAFHKERIGASAHVVEFNPMPGAARSVVKLRRKGNDETEFLFTLPQEMDPALVGALLDATSEVAAPPGKEVLGGIATACETKCLDEIQDMVIWFHERLQHNSTVVKHKSLVTLQLLFQKSVSSLLIEALRSAPAVLMEIQLLKAFEAPDDPQCGSKPVLMVRPSLNPPFAHHSLAVTGPNKHHQNNCKNKTGDLSILPPPYHRKQN